MTETNDSRVTGSKKNLLHAPEKVELNATAIFKNSSNGTKISLRRIHHQKM